MQSQKSPSFNDAPIIQFGKHRGLKYSQLPIEYLKWMSREIKSPERTVLQVAIELYRRKVAGPPHPNKLNRETHYEWAHPDGTTIYEIPIDVSMVGTATQLPPF